MKVTAKITAISIVGLFLFLADRWIKLWLIRLPGTSFDIFGHWFRLELMTNQGVAFSWPINFKLLLVLYVIIIIFLCWAIANRLTSKDLRSFGALVLVIAGAFSNFLDRIKFGYVIDYLYLKNFSVFNIADAMITVGALAFILLNFFNNKSINEKQ